ncbi:hypothetical protein SDC9_173847 [bioreactor metagenome]|uniref:Uncharacterized protein n=1 Tax=bioreactor metagenome TaxID=1076179 RepID=A0A645GS18_9ZZZZ
MIVHAHHPLGCFKVDLLHMQKRVDPARVIDQHIHRTKLCQDFFRQPLDRRPIRNIRYKTADAVFAGGSQTQRLIQRGRIDIHAGDLCAARQQL